MNKQQSARHSAAPALALALILSAGAAPAGAQETCPDGNPPQGWIGVYAFHCPGGACLYERVRSDRVRAQYEFSSEPRLRAVDSGGPGAGILEEGDVLVAVNGYLITGRRGGRELANLPVGEAARLTLRRGDRLEEVTVAPVARCEPAMVVVGNTRLMLPAEAPALAGVSTGRGSAPGALSAPDAAALAGTLVAPLPPSRASGAGVAAAPSQLAPSAFAVLGQPGSLGMAFGCDGCSFTLGDGGAFTWNTPQLLEVQAVTEGGAAEQAGLQPGDILTHVNGLSLETDAAGRLIFRSRVGEVLRLRYERHGTSRETVLVAGLRSGLGGVGGVSLRSDGARWGSLVGRLAGLGRSAVPLPTLAEGSSLMITGESWGPSRLGAVFKWCDECAWIIENGTTRWEMNEYPVVVGVNPGGPAQVAGLRVGDVLTHVDGLDMKTNEAAARFLNARDGDRLRLSYQRDGRKRETVLIAGQGVPE